MSTITGTAGSDTLFGGDDGDVIAGLAGDDTLYGAAGDDSLDGGSGADRIFGGDGIDGVSYSTSGSALTLALEGAVGRGGGTRKATCSSASRTLPARLSTIG